MRMKPKTLFIYLLLYAILLVFILYWRIFANKVRKYPVDVILKATQVPFFRTTENKLYLKPVLGNNGQYIALLYSAVAGNSSNGTRWDRLSVTSWTFKSHEMRVDTCCVLFSYGMLKPYPIMTESVAFKRCDLPVKQYVCAINDTGTYPGTEKPVSMSVVNEDGVCGRNQTAYVDIAYAYRQPERIALFGKIVYGNISALNLIAWMEVHKLYGYDKVLVYTHELNKDAWKVLNYYTNKDLLETVPFFLPGPEQGVTRTKLGTKNTQGWSDERVAYGDALERLRGYTYLVSIDTDEYLVPTRHTTWKELFNDLWKRQPNAAGFKLRTYFYRKGFEYALADSPFDVCRYLNRTPALIERPKHVTMPDRVTYNGLSPHGASPMGGYRTYMMREQDAVLRHYRTCKPKDIGSKFSCHVNRTMDLTMQHVFKRVEKDVFIIAKLLGLYF